LEAAVALIELGFLIGIVMERTASAGLQKIAQENLEAQGQSEHFDQVR